MWDNLLKSVAAKNALARNRGLQPQVGMARPDGSANMMGGMKTGQAPSGNQAPNMGQGMLGLTKNLMQRSGAPMPMPMAGGLPPVGQTMNKMMPPAGGAPGGKASPQGQQDDVRAQLEGLIRR